MKKYAIKVFYRTGDSFNTYDRDMILEMTWDNLDIAKENLKRIKEHYKWYDSKHNHSILNEKPISKPVWLAESKYDFVLNLKMDDGNDFDYSASSWCGYFEKLYGARIIQDDSDLYFKLDEYYEKEI